MWISTSSRATTATQTEIWCNILIASVWEGKGMLLQKELSAISHIMPQIRWGSFLAYALATPFNKALSLQWLCVCLHRSREESWCQYDLQVGTGRSLACLDMPSNPDKTDEDSRALTSNLYNITMFMGILLNIWEEETIHHPAPVRNFSLLKDMGATEEDLSVDMAALVLIGFCIYHRQWFCLRPEEFFQMIFGSSVRSPCRKRSPAKGVWQKVTKKVTEASEEVTERAPKNEKKVIELLLPTTFCGTLIRLFSPLSNPGISTNSLRRTSRTLWETLWRSLRTPLRRRSEFPWRACGRIGPLKKGTLRNVLPWSPYAP